MSNILITGGLGYIGSSLTKRLRLEGHRVVVFDTLMYRQWQYTHHAVDLSCFYDEDVLNWSDNLISAVEKANIIIPLAAIVGAPACDATPTYATNINFNWYTHLLKYLRPEQLVVYPNTNSGYGTTPDGVICTEETKMDPLSLYGVTKLATEKLLLKHHYHTVVLRLATVFGMSYRPRLDLLVNNLTYRAATTGDIDIFDGEYRRNFIHVKDLVDVFSWFVEDYDLTSKEYHGQAYNVGNDSINTTKKDLAHRIKHTVGCSVTVNKNKTDPDKRDYMVSSEKLFKLTGLQPRRSLEVGIQEVYNFAKYLDIDQGVLQTTMFNY